MLTEPANADERAQPVAYVPAEINHVVCFDFDRCLMKSHWWGTHQNNPLAGIDPQPKDFAHDDIGDLLNRLFEMSGVQVAVASFGRHDVIRKAIRSAVGEELADTVYITTP